MTTLTVGADEIVELSVEVPPGDVITYNLANLCSALDISDPTRIAVETDGVRRGLITIYPSNPLAEVRAVTAEDLLMDHAGRINVGRYHNGRTAKRRLFDPRTGSAQRFMLFGTTGAGKSRTLQLQLAAEKANRIISWLADLKGGQSVPEAAENVDFHVTTLEGAILMLRALVEVIKERSARYSRMGRSAFVVGDPDPLLHGWIDEANRLLEKGSDYRDEGTYLVKEIGRTGRSVGVGIGLAAQASHLEELGGSDTLRAMLKEGEVTLLRWSSSMMRQLVSDGLLPAGEQLLPIPKNLRQRRLVSQFDLVEYDDDDEDGPGTQGTGYLLSGPHPTSMMRHFRIGSIAPSPGLDPEILALYGDDDPARLEAASHDAAGEAYATRHDPATMAALCKALAEEGQEDSGTGTGSKAPAGKTRTAAPRLVDRVRAALGRSEDPMSADDVLAAVNADGGREIRLGTVRNALGELADAKEAVRTGRGMYAQRR